MDKSKALSAALSQIERQFGKGSVMKLGKTDKSMDIETVSTGSLGLDIALGIGGLPRGRIVEIYGPESSGKTTLSLHTIAEAQKKGGICAFVDVEHALDPIYARKLGVNIRQRRAASRSDHQLCGFIVDDAGMRSRNEQVSNGHAAVKILAAAPTQLQAVSRRGTGAYPVGEFRCAIRHQNRGSSGCERAPPLTCMPPNSAQRCSVGIFLEGLSNSSGSNARFTPRNSSSSAGLNCTHI